jgi:NAD(P)H-hydrate epimerase
VPEPIILDDRAVAAWLPHRPVRGHKGSFGKLLIVAGSLDYLGAAFLVARAAGRAGVGLIRLAVPASLQPLVAGRVLEATTLGLPESAPGVVEPAAALERLADLDHDAAAIGPGLRAGPATVDLVRRYLGAARPGGPASVDAEALNALAGLEAWPEGIARLCVLTPHAGEFARLAAHVRVPGAEAADLVTDDAARAEVTRSAAAAFGQVVLLKGARTVIAEPDGRVACLPFENPALATGGTGDVLTGTIGALLAQGLEPFEAACVGAYLHGAAGEAIRDRFGDAGLLASDLPDEIARARRRLAALAPAAGGRRLGFSLPEPAG